MKGFVYIAAMRFLVVGAGGVGGYLGARLVAAGQDVQFVARGAHAQALAAQGLLIRGPQGDERIAVGKPLEARALTGHFDVVLVAVKWPGLGEACSPTTLCIAGLPCVNNVCSAAPPPAPICQP